MVLSACQSAVGRHAGGEGYLGFSQALLLAGARSVVLSLWKVDDTATALLITRFYENLLGARSGLKDQMPKAEALEEAQRWLRDLVGPQLETAVSGLSRGTGRAAPAATPGQPSAPGAALGSGAVSRPYADPYYWAAFILVGDPD